jgi:DMSO/TMAO reductase YedYZ molybdopterin-dependent catalytic subunit
MRHLPSKLLVLLVLFPLFPLLSGGPSAAAEQFRLVVDGEVTTPLDLSEADFKKLPRMSLKVKDAGGHDVTYEGVDLAEILQRAGTPLKDGLKGVDVAKYLHAEGTDGFAAVFSLPEFDSTTFLVADTANASTLPADSGPLQIISPNEKRHSRWVKHLTLLRIKKTQK